MPKKYVKGKDGKFKGSIGDPNSVPQIVNNTVLPTLPKETVTVSTISETNNITKLYQKAQLLQKEPAETSQTNSLKPPTVLMLAKNVTTGQMEELEVIESKLTNESREAESNRLVRIPRDELRFMDKDKLTNALGYSIMGQGFSLANNTVTYETYAEDTEYVIYRVDMKG